MFFSPGRLTKRPGKATVAGEAGWRQRCWPRPGRSRWGPEPTVPPGLFLPGLGHSAAGWSILSEPGTSSSIRGPLARKEANQLRSGLWTGNGGEKSLFSTLAPLSPSCFWSYFLHQSPILAPRGGCFWLPRAISVPTSDTPSAEKIRCKYKETYEGPIPLKLWEKLWESRQDSKPFISLQWDAWPPWLSAASSWPRSTKGISPRPRLCSWSQYPFAQSLAYVVSMRFGCSSRNHFSLP